MIVLSLVPVLAISGFFVFMKVALLINEEFPQLAKMNQVVLLSKDMNLHIVQVQQWLTDISATRAEKGFDDGFAEAETHFYASLEILGKIEKIGYLEKEESTSLRNKITSFYETGKVMANKYISEGPKGGNQYMGTFDQVAEDLQSSLDPMLKKVEQSHAEVTSAITQYISQIRNIVMMSFIGLIVYSSLILIVFGKKLIKNLSEKADQLSENVNALINSSVDLKKASKYLSEVVMTQASSLQQTVSSIDEISSMVQRSADAAQNSKKVSHQSNSAAGKGKKTVEMMIHSIDEIESKNTEIMTEMENNNNEISKIVEMISKIDEKTKVINDIVFQTKLLSFNASVEAARAGEHGKGFAVVAEEVGNLASMSGKAALEITTLLDSSLKQVNEIFNSTKAKVDVLVESGKETVELGKKNAYDCEQSLDEILQNVGTVNDMVEEISLASSEQAVGVSEVTKAMQSLDKTTFENTSIAKQVSQMALDLESQAEIIDQSVVELMALVGDKVKMSPLSDEKKKIHTNRMSFLSMIRPPQHPRH